MSLKIKICGLKHAENILEISKYPINYCGFIFYQPSKRYFLQQHSLEGLQILVEELNIQKIVSVAVFVDETIEEMNRICQSAHISHIQLHGDETPQTCASLRDKGYTIIKAFGIDTSFNFETISPYKNDCDYFLFDTKTPQHGGSGQTFDWKILKGYPIEKPFFLSGGIGLDEIPSVLKINHPQLYALDFNSKLEIEPGLKNIELVKNMVDKMTTRLS